MATNTEVQTIQSLTSINQIQSQLIKSILQLLISIGITQMDQLWVMLVDKPWEPEN
jgi:hypothetical protein